MPTVSEKRATFRKLHESGCFVIPNPFDIGSARYLQRLGFKALATTSSGFAYTQARADHGVTCEMMLTHLRAMVAATDLPLNADFENGYADDPDSVAENVRRCVETGVSGLSIEDATNDPAKPIYDFDQALARVRAARKAIDACGGDVVFTARAEGVLLGASDLDDVIRRLRAFADAGADCLFAPGLKTREQMQAVISAVAPKPVNFLIGTALPFSVAEIASFGARRISIGGALARAAWGGFMRAAQEIAQKGTFTSFADAAAGNELNSMFSARNE